MIWTYCCLQSEPNGFADFHLYVCAAFLTRFSKELLREKDFQVCMILVCTFEKYNQTQAVFKKLLILNRY